MAEQFHTVRGLVARIKRESGEQQAPVGERRIRVLIAEGDLPATLEGNRHLIRWGDWCDYQRRRAEAHAEQARRRAEARGRADSDVERRVQHQLGRERKAG